MKRQSMRVAQYIRGQLAAFMGYSHDGTRDLYAQFGYPRELDTKAFITMYQREGIATRLIRAFPQATWRDAPLIRDGQGSSSDKEDADYSEFVKAVDNLFEAHQILHTLERADRLASLGQFGLLVLGFRDGMPMDQPLGESQAQLLYAQGYMQDNVTVSQWETDIASPRFGKPTIYTVQTGTWGAQQSSAKKSFTVHWTRCIHIAEHLDQDDTYGIPRLQPIYNRLMDLQKILGGSSEMYWLNASRGVALTADPDANIDDDALKDMKAQLDDFDNQLRRNLALQGVTATQLQSEVQDPSAIIDRLLDSIAGSVGIPKRILIGSEMGQLASGQDENNWADRITERRKSFAGPCILHPFISKMIVTGNLPEPVEQFWIDWPDSSASPERQANLGNTRTTMLRNYLSTPGAEIVVPAAEFRKDFLGIPAQSEYEESDIDQELEELLAPPSLPMLPGMGGEEPLPEDDEEVKTQFAKNRRLRTLYVYRKVKNAQEIIDHFKRQGVKTTLKANDLHVTIMYSATPVDWMKASSPWTYGDAEDVRNGVLRIPPGGPRDVDLFGDGDCLVLLFNNQDLSWRHETLLNIGCTFKFATYQPHITISHKFGGTLEGLEPFTGKIVLGPEIFAEVDTNWSDKIVENGRRRRVRLFEVHYSPDQDRDEEGKFADGGGGSGSKTRKLSDPRGHTDKTAHKEIAKETVGPPPIKVAEAKAIDDYTADGYEAINTFLRGNDPSDVISDEHAEEIYAMDAMFERSSLSEPLTVYRVMPPELLNGMKDGTVFQDDGFVSTSGSPDINYILGGETGTSATPVKINLPKGSRAVPVAHLSAMPKENEVLIDRGSRFKVSTGANGVKELTLLT